MQAALPRSDLYIAGEVDKALLLELFSGIDRRRDFFYALGNRPSATPFFAPLPLHLRLLPAGGNTRLTPRAANIGRRLHASLSHWNRAAERAVHGQHVIPVGRCQ